MPKSKTPKTIDQQLAEVAEALAETLAEREQAEAALAQNSNDRQAQKTCESIDAAIRELTDQKARLERVQAKQAAQAGDAAEAEARKSVGAAIERVLGRQRRRAANEQKKIDLMVLAGEIEAEENAINAENARDIQTVVSLTGEHRSRHYEMIVRTANNPGTGLIIGETMRAAGLGNDPRSLSPRVEFTLPQQPYRIADQSHDNFAAWEAGRPKAVKDQIAKHTEALRELIDRIVGPPPAPSNGAPWHGRSPSDRADSFTKVLAVNAGNLKADDDARRTRKAKRVANSAKPVERDTDGKVVSQDLS